jgi:phage terminase large subunit-like protein
MCVCAVGSPLKEPIGMNEKYVKRGNNGQGNHPQPHYDFTERPPYEFYRQGITESHKSLFEAIVTSGHKAGGRYLVAAIAIIFLYKIACEFIAKGSENPSSKAFIGVLLIAAMILAVGLVSLLWVKDTDATEIQKTEKGKNESFELGTGGKGQRQNRRTSTRDGFSNPDGGSK